MSCKRCGETLQFGDDQFVICHKCGATNTVEKTVNNYTYKSNKDIEKKSKRKSKKSLVLNLLSVCMVSVIVLLVGVQAFSGGLSDSAGASNAIVEEVEGDVIAGSEDNTNINTGIKYSKDTILDAWNYAMAYLTGTSKETYYGRQSTMTGSLVISASGIPNGFIPTQQFYTKSIMDSNKNIYQYTKSTGYAVVEAEVYANKESNTIWSINGGVKEKRSYEDYAVTEGNTPDGFPIIVSSDTIISSSVKFCIDKGYYKYTFSVDPISSTEGYVKKIQKNGESFTDGGLPQFKSIELEVLINSKGYFYKISRKEVYTMNAKVSIYKGLATCTANYTEIFDPDYNDKYISTESTKPSWELW